MRQNQHEITLIWTGLTMLRWLDLFYFFNFCFSSYFICYFGYFAWRIRHTLNLVTSIKKKKKGTDPYPGQNLEGIRKNKLGTTGNLNKTEACLSPRKANDFQLYPACHLWLHKTIIKLCAPGNRKGWISKTHKKPLWSLFVQIIDQHSSGASFLLL